MIINNIFKSFVKDYIINIIQLEQKIRLLFNILLNELYYDYKNEFYKKSYRINKYILKNIINREHISYINTLHNQKRQLKRDYIKNRNMIYYILSRILCHDISRYILSSYIDKNIYNDNIYYSYIIFHGVKNDIKKY